jgi:hypothetical protein
MPVLFARPRAPLAALALLVLALVAGPFALRPPAARAGSSQFSIMQDDDLLLYRGNKVRDKTLREMRALGVDALRVTVLWRNVADGAPHPGANPHSYPRANWDRYDELVKSVTRLHMTVIFNVTGPGPPQFRGHPSNRSVASAYKPNAREFYKFVKAVGTRYAGAYRDENYGHTHLPAVRWWSIWNEPNQGAWLAPQYVNGRPYSPQLYRELYLRAHQALAETGHGRDEILAGETAPLGSNANGARAPMRPAKFIRELFCLQPNNLPYTGAAASARGCGLFSQFAGQGGWLMSGWAHHPYTKKLAPTARDPNPDAITLANIGDLGRLLDTVASTTHLIAAGKPLFVTEYGYETKPPDPFAGIPQSTQSAWLNVGDEIMFHDPRILSTTQFLYRDQPPVRSHRRGSPAYWFTYQSGLRYASGKAKPALVAYAFPFNLTPAAPGPGGQGLYTAWGQLRFRPNFQTTDLVGLQFRPQGSPTWTTEVSFAVANQVGYFEVPLAAQGRGAWRAVWLVNGQPLVGSREIPVSY